MTTFVGVDGGGTQARAVVITAQGAELARVAGPAGLVDPRDPQRAAGIIAQLVRDALARAGAAPPAAALCCGLAGVGRDAEREAVRSVLVLDGAADQVTVVGDAETAMHDAFDGEPGVLIVSGTGSIAWAQNEGRPAVRVGGWGTLLGDEGSGYAIGLDAMRAVMRAHDGREQPSRLAHVVSTAAAVADPDSLVAYAAAATKRDVAALAPLVLECARTGDAAAVTIRDRAVAELAALAVHAARRAGLAAPAVGLTGGLLAPGGPLRDAVATAIAAALPGASITNRPIDAARGAANIARAAASPGSHP